jgi:5-methylcytosine-specific restriction endonuclease McrA
MILKHLKDIIQGKAPVGAARSSKWSRVRFEHLVKNPFCSVCSGRAKLEVHHVRPFHQSPELELDPTNLITLCESKTNGINCHLAFGHLGNYKSANPDVKSDALIWSKKIRTRK